MATLREWYAATVERNGVLAPAVGDLRAPEAFTIAGLSSKQHEYDIGPGVQQYIYSVFTDGVFERFGARIVSEGTLRMAWQVEDAGTPGTKLHWQHAPTLSCKTPFLLTADDLQTIASASDMNADDGNGQPALWANAGRSLARVRYIRVLNPGSATVRLRTWLFA